MGYRNNRLDSCLDGCRAKGRRGGRAGLAWIIAFGVILIASAGPALGQFNVQPMKVDLQPRAGKRIVTMIDGIMTICNAIKEKLQDVQSTTNQLAGAIVENAVT